MSQHMISSHVHDPRAIARRTSLGTVIEDPAAAHNLMDRSRLAQARLKLLSGKAAFDEKNADAARDAEASAKAALKAATEKRIAAEKQAAVSKAAAKAVSLPQQMGRPAKKPKHGEAGASDAPMAETDAAKDAAAQPTAEQVAAAESAPWETYTHQMFKALATKYSNSSSVEIDPNNTDTSQPPRGDDGGRRGWRNQHQHGMIGAIQHWAEGSPHRVAFMLSEMAVHFGVVDRVRMAWCEAWLGARVGLA
jgi:hypothetical protein